MKNKYGNLKNIIGRIYKVEPLRDIGISVLSIILAMAIGALFILMINKSPVQAYAALFKGAFGSTRGISNTLSRTVPLIFTGLSVALAFRCGLFNIGGEGQLYIGALASVLVALKFPLLPWFILLPAAILAGFISGAICGGFAGILKAKLGINEVIVTIMLNYILMFFTSYLVNGPFKAKGMISQTDQIPGAAVLQTIVKNTQLTTGLYIAIFMVFLVYWFLWKTAIGYSIRVVGQNPTAAQSGGINVAKNIIIAMTLSGGIAGLAGVTEVLGTYHRFIDNFSPGFGFTGIAVAVLGRNHPIGVVFTGLLFGALEAGALNMARVTSIPVDMIGVIQGLVILFVAMPEIIKIFRIKRRKV